MMGRSRHDHLILCRASISILNIFRLSGDMVHLLSFVVLVLKINATKSCRGRGSDPDLWDRPCGLMHGIVLLSSCMGSSMCPLACPCRNLPQDPRAVHAGVCVQIPRSLHQLHLPVGPSVMGLWYHGPPASVCLTSCPMFHAGTTP